MQATHAYMLYLKLNQAPAWFIEPTLQLVLCPDPYQGLVTHNRQKNLVTNQIQDNKSMSPAVTSFAQIDSTIPKVEMNFSVY